MANHHTEPVKGILTKISHIPERGEGVRLIITLTATINDFPDRPESRKRMQMQTKQEPCKMHNGSS